VREGSNIRKYAEPPGKPQDEAEWKSPWRRGFLTEREGSAQSFSISMRRQDGREGGGFSTGIYLRHHWIDSGPQLERLLLMFSEGGIYVEGQHLQRGLDALEEGKLRRIQVHDSSEVALIKAHNAQTRKAEEKEPLVLRVVISPSVESVLEADENLAEIAKVVKEDYAHNG
jgi:hypothetical protein